MDDTHRNYRHSSSYDALWQLRDDSPPRRTYLFPCDEDFGELSIHTLNAHGWVTEWREHGRAKGSVSVPRGHAIRLTVDEDSPKDLSILATMAPSDLESVWLFFLDRKSSRSLAWIDGVGHVRELRIEGAWLRDHHVKEIGSLRALRNLDISWSSITDEGMRLFPKSPQLRALSLGARNVTDDGVRWIPKRFPNLGHLSVGVKRSTDETLHKLRPLTSLLSLDLDRARLRGDGLRAVSSSLEEFGLQGARLSKEAIAHISRFSAMRMLWLRDAAIPRDSGNHLAELANLRVLDLDNVKTIGDGDLEAMRSLKKLRVLRMGWASVTDDGMEALSRMNELRELDLCRTAITDAGLLKLTRLRKLERLEIFNTLVTEAGLKRFRAAVPGCKVDA